MKHAGDRRRRPNGGSSPSPSTTGASSIGRALQPLREADGFLVRVQGSGFSGVIERWFSSLATINTDEVDIESAEGQSAVLGRPATAGDYLGNRWFESIHVHFRQRSSVGRAAGF